MSTTKRQPLSKKMRFEVFKRDRFTCQYCGRKAPDVVLHVDHVQPCSKGGTTDLLNLVTACRDCNTGKSNRLLSDSDSLQKTRQQMEDLQQRKEQLEMMYEWQKSLIDLDGQALDMLAGFWSEQVEGWSLNDNGLKGLRKLNARFGADEVMTAIHIATDHYLKAGEDGNLTAESVENAWSKVGGICFTRQQERDNPNIPLQRLYRVRSMLRHRLSCSEDSIGAAYRRATDAVIAGVGIDIIELAAGRADGWTKWMNLMDDLISGVDGDG